MCMSQTVSFPQASQLLGCQPSLTRHELRHGVGGCRQVDDRGLDLGHHKNAVGNTLGANATVAEALQHKPNPGQHNMSAC